MRVHIVTPANRGLYGVQLDQMHRQRREVFIDRLGWTEIDTGDALERDEFDTPDTFYLLLLGDIGEVLGSARLLPTWKPHLFETTLGDFLNDRDRARGPGIWEVSRWIAGPGFDPKTDRICRALMFAALAEFGLHFGATAVVASVDETFMAYFDEIGVPIETLGGPVSYGQGQGYAVRCEVSIAALRGIRALMKLRAPAAFTAGAVLDERPNDPVRWAILDRLLEVENRSHLESLLGAIHMLTEAALGSAEPETVRRRA